MRNSVHEKHKKFMAIMLIIACFFITSVFTYRDIMERITASRDESVIAFKEDQFKVIWSAIETLSLDAKKQVTEVSKNIESDILSLSKDELKSLENQMTNSNNMQEVELLHDILMSHISNKDFNGINNHMNGILVLTVEGFVEDFNYLRALSVVSGEEPITREWQSAIDNSYNKVLEIDAIDKLMNRRSGIIALESFDITKNDDHIKIKEMTYNNLLNVFMEEGLDGLKNYQILVPYYITDCGDIFGKPDIVNGVKNKNNKLIIVQEFNLYDQIVNQYNDIISNDTQIKHIVHKYNEILRTMYIFGILIITSIIALIIYLFRLCDALILQNMHKKEESKE